jgi:MATE family multidrug resistance protein
MAIFAITFITLRQFLPTLYIDNPEVVSIAASLLIVAGLFQISDGVQAVGLGILRGITDVKVPMVISFFSYWVIGFPVGYILGFMTRLGVVGIWIGLLLGLTLAAILFTLRFYRRTAKTDLIE